MNTGQQIRIADSYITKYSVIGEGAVLTKSTPSCKIWEGNTAIIVSPVNYSNI